MSRGIVIEYFWVGSLMLFMLLRMPPPCGVSGVRVYGAAAVTAEGGRAGERGVRHRRKAEERPRDRCLPGT
ncbi:hypothetical protein GCM10010287_17990 [Streptomyces variabilis]|uniref:Secreted protein n=1 Tax=Streptomyces variabilis TaxID=67372 RepID=A0ABQ2TXP2_9ACTN|nr:hypothetical protein GCM10010265_31850 [Streptomyces griseoincarnatus]GGT45177.1 hypothetical protein GCM10010287_17990 [Streptomyces variabilis]